MIEPEPSKPSDALEQQAMPIAQPVAREVPENEEWFTERDINAFYAEVTKGRWDRRQDEKQAIMARINQALANGRTKP